MPDENSQAAASSARPHFRLQLSGWWLVPVFLAGWVARSLVAPPGSAVVETKESASSFLEQSLGHAKAGRFTECVTAAQRAVALDSSLAEGYANIGWCAANLGQWDEGIKNTREALRLKPDMEVARNNLNWILAEMMKQKGQSPTTPAATPISSAATTMVAQSLEAAKAERFGDCVKAAERATKLDPKSPEAFSNLGWCSAKLGNWKDGIENTREALRLRPNMETARNNLNWMLAEVSKATNRAPANDAPSADSALALSLQHANERRFPECVSAARQAIAQRPDMAEAHNNLGYCYAAMGKWDEGIASVREALRLKPDFALARNNLVWMLQEKIKAGGRAGQK